MRSISVFLLLFNCTVGQEQVPFSDETRTLLGALNKLGTGQLPPGFAEAKDLATIKDLRVEAAKKQVAALRARFESGLDNMNILLRAQIELALAKLDTTDVKAKQLEYIREGLSSSIMVWQRVAELQRIGAPGGGAASLAQAEKHVFRFYVWWHKCNAGQEIGPTLADPGLWPR